MKTVPVVGILVSVEDYLNGKIGAARLGLEAGWNLLWSGLSMWAGMGERGIIGTAGGPRGRMRFTSATKTYLKMENALRNGGVMRCSFCDVELAAPERHIAGVTPPMNELQVDHGIARALGGDGALSNGQLSCRLCNLTKSDGAAPSAGLTSPLPAPIISSSESRE